jgi:hypothetical protein
LLARTRHCSRREGPWHVREGSEGGAAHAVALAEFCDGYLGNIAILTRMILLKKETITLSRKEEIEKQFTLLDIIKGLLFIVGLLALYFLMMWIGGTVFFDYILNIKNPIILILVITGFLVLFVSMIALSKIKQAGYQKNIFSELYKLFKGK